MFALIGVEICLCSCVATLYTMSLLSKSGMLTLARHRVDCYGSISSHAIAACHGERNTETQAIKTAAGDSVAIASWAWSSRPTARKVGMEVALWYSRRSLLSSLMASMGMVHGSDRKGLYESTM